MIKAGEASGKLDVFLLKLVSSLEKTEKVKKKIKGALMYPMVMFSTAMIVSNLYVRADEVYKTM